GGGFFAGGNATVTGGAFTSNVAGSGCFACEGSGGGIFGAGTVTGVTFSNNVAQCGLGCDGSGGAIWASGPTLTVTASTFNTNQATVGVDLSHPSGGPNCQLDTTVTSSRYDHSDDTSCGLTGNR